MAADQSSIGAHDGHEKGAPPMEALMWRLSIETTTWLLLLSSAALCGSHHGTRVGTPCHLGRGGLLKGDRSPSGGQWVGGS